MAARLLDVQAFARAVGQSVRTARRWLRAWRALGVAGIRTAASRGRHGMRYLVEAALVTRWRRGALPSPQPRARAA